MYFPYLRGRQYNLALFDPDLAECIETKVYRIETLEYGKQLVS